MMRTRVTYRKLDALRYTGNLDLHRVWERALRRSRLPVAYSQGFNPQARLNLASALPLGFTSQHEVLDVWLDDLLPLDEIRERLLAALPPGIEITAIEAVDLRAPALQTQVSACCYRVAFPHCAPSGLPACVDALLAAEALPRTRRDKPYNLRPLIEALSVSPDGVLEMRLAAREGATGRPEEVLDALGLDPNDARVERIELIFVS